MSKLFLFFLLYLICNEKLKISKNNLHKYSKKICGIVFLFRSDFIIRQPKKI